MFNKILHIEYTENVENNIASLCIECLMIVLTVFIDYNPSQPFFHLSLLIEHKLDINSNNHFSSILCTFNRIFAQNMLIKTKSQTVTRNGNNIKIITHHIGG